MKSTSSYSSRGEKPAPPPQYPPDDVFAEIERLKRQPIRFSCLGMGCGTFFLVVGVLLLILYIIKRW